MDSGHLVLRVMVLEIQECLALLVAHSLRLLLALLVISLTFHLLCFLCSLLLKIFSIAVAYEYFIPCLLQALEVSSFSPSASGFGCC